MNWFQRYGIPGIYFVSLSAVFLWIISGFLPPKDVAPTVLGIALFISLPIGYILVIFSQFLHYLHIKRVIPWQIHRHAWENVKKEKLKEWKAEVESTLLGRLYHPTCMQDIEKGKWMQDWFMKRFDIMAINWALIVATSIGLVAGVVGWLLKPEKSICWFIFLVLSAFILLVLILSSRLLAKQAKDIAVKNLEKLVEKTG